MVLPQASYSARFNALNAKANSDKQKYNVNSLKIQGAGLDINSQQLDLSQKQLDLNSKVNERQANSNMLNSALQVASIGNSIYKNKLDYDAKKKADAETATKLKDATDTQSLNLVLSTYSTDNKKSSSLDIDDGSAIFTTDKNGIPQITDGTRTKANDKKFEEIVNNSNWSDNVKALALAKQKEIKNSSQETSFNQWTAKTIQEHDKNYTANLQVAQNNDIIGNYGVVSYADFKTPNIEQTVNTGSFTPEQKQAQINALKQETYKNYIKQYSGEIAYNYSYADSASLINKSNLSVEDKQTFLKNAKAIANQQDDLVKSNSKEFAKSLLNGANTNGSEIISAFEEKAQQNGLTENRIKLGKEAVSEILTENADKVYTQNIKNGDATYYTSEQWNDMLKKAKTDLVFSGTKETEEARKEYSTQILEKKNTAKVKEQKLIENLESERSKENIDGKTFDYKNEVNLAIANNTSSSGFKDIVDKLSVVPENESEKLRQSRESALTTAIKEMNNAKEKEDKLQDTLNSLKIKEKNGDTKYNYSKILSLGNAEDFNSSQWKEIVDSTADPIEGETTEEKRSREQANIKAIGYMNNSLKKEKLAKESITKTGSESFTKSEKTKLNNGMSIIKNQVSSGEISAREGIDRISSLEKSIISNNRVTSSYSDKINNGDEPTDYDKKTKGLILNNDDITSFSLLCQSAINDIAEDLPIKYKDIMKVGTDMITDTALHSAFPKYKDKYTDLDDDQQNEFFQKKLQFSKEANEEMLGILMDVKNSNPDLNDEFDVIDRIQSIADTFNIKNYQNESKYLNDIDKVTPFLNESDGEDLSTGTAPVHYSNKSNSFVWHNDNSETNFNAISDVVKSSMSESGIEINKNTLSIPAIINGKQTVSPSFKGTYNGEKGVFVALKDDNGDANIYKVSGKDGNDLKLIAPLENKDNTEMSKWEMAMGSLADTYSGTTGISDYEKAKGKEVEVKANQLKEETKDLPNYKEMDTKIEKNELNSKGIEIDNTIPKRDINITGYGTVSVYTGKNSNKYYTVINDKVYEVSNNKLIPIGEKNE